MLKAPRRVEPGETFCHVCGRMLTYAHVCSRMFTYAHVCSRMLLYVCPHTPVYVSSYYYMCVLILLTYADVCRRDGHCVRPSLVRSAANTRCVCSRMLTYAHVCSRMLTYDHVCSRMLTFFGLTRSQQVCMLMYAHVCSRMLTYAGVC